MSTTYTGRAAPATDDTVPVALPPDPDGSWLPRTHPRLLQAAAAQALLALPLLVGYAFVAGDPATHRATRTLLLCGGLTLVLLAGAAAVAAAAVAGIRTMILTATAHGAGQVLDQELRLVSPSWSARTAEEMRQERERYVRAVLDQLSRIEAALPERLGERLETVEQGVASLLGTLNGSVVLLRQPEPEDQPANGSRPTGIDATAISMAREFTERIRRLEGDS